jgi:hypothetical protein
MNAAEEGSEVQKLQLQVYLSEYQAMMTRVNWFMSMQSLPLVPLIAFFAFVATADNYFKYDPILVTWGVVSVTYVAAVIYCVALHEVYNHLVYIETDLKGRVAVLLQINRDSFWAWERHLKRVGKAQNQTFVDLAPTLIAFLPFIVAVSLAVNRTLASGCKAMGWDLLGLTTAGSLMIAVVVLTRRVIKMRKTLEASIQRVDSDVQNADYPETRTGP